VFSTRPDYPDLVTSDHRITVLAGRTLILGANTLLQFHFRSLAPVTIGLICAHSPGIRLLKAG
jgi:hypothetical protein